MMTDPAENVSVEPRRDWFAVRTQAQREGLTTLHLARQGFPVFFPRTYARAPQKARTKKARTERPFFPGYVFVQLDLQRDRWRCVNSTFGAIGLVQFGERPAPAPRGFVEALIARTTPDGLVGPDALRVGDQVRILGGPFDQSLATLFALPSHDRVSVLIQMMTREVEVHVPRAALVVVSQPPQSTPPAARARAAPALIREVAHGHQ